MARLRNCSAAECQASLCIDPVRSTSTSLVVNRSASGGMRRSSSSLSHHSIKWRTLSPGTITALPESHAVERSDHRIEPKLGLLRIRTVTIETMFTKNRHDVMLEIRRHCKMDLQRYRDERACQQQPPHQNEVMVLGEVQR